MTRRPLSLIDSTFLRVESPATPMHVASLLVVAPPPEGDPTFAANIVERMRRPDPLVAPFNLLVATGARALLRPALVPADTVDLTYHVRHTRLPEPGGERELGELISHLHGGMLDRSRPLWTCHVIEGLSDGRVAIYTKIHHALVDGVRGIALTGKAASNRSDGDDWGGMWHLPRSPRFARVDKGGRSLLHVPTAVVGGVAEGATDVASLALAAAAYVRRPGTEPVRVLFEAPGSKLNRRVTAARRVATQQLDLGRVRAVGKASGTSVNDVFLALCGGAIRRHLLESDELPTRSLIAGVPVSVVDPSGARGNSSGFSLASLATHLEDPLERLRAINTSMGAVKSQLAPMSPRAQLTFLTATFAPAMGVLISGTGAVLPPPMNVTISNVPGPREPLYINGGRVEAIYPMSIPFQGQALNITCVSYDGQLNIGFAGSRDNLPHLQRLALHTADGLDELEAALGVATPSTTSVRLRTSHKSGPD